MKHLKSFGKDLAQSNLIQYDIWKGFGQIFLTFLDQA